MPKVRPYTDADHAAEAFYGQAADAFASEISNICRNDTRLIAVFERTRDRYLESERPAVKVVWHS